MKIAHVVNPVFVKETSDLYVAQPVTFESMKRAKEFAKGNVDVEQYVVCFPEDEGVAPDFLCRLPMLERSVMDVGDFKEHRKLPLINDILERLYKQSDADYFIYSNVDISLMPHFYVTLEQIIRDGYDGFVVNRRTISKEYEKPDQLPFMYAQPGKKHPGFDCFVFKRDVFPDYRLGTACVGGNWIGRVMIANVIAHSTLFKVFEGEHLTFHIGDDRAWTSGKFDDYHGHNERQLALTLSHVLTEKRERRDKHMEFLRELYQFHLKNMKKSKDKQTRLFLEENRELVEKSFELLPAVMVGSYGLRQDPVFILGFPRSGTTLLQSLVSTQEDIYSFPETHFFTKALGKLQFPDGKEKGGVTKHSLDAAIEFIKPRVNLSSEAIAAIHRLNDEKAFSGKDFFEIVVRDNLVRQMESRNEASAIESIRWVEKTPLHELHVEEIARYYPKAKFIYIFRHPFKSFSSWRRVAEGWGGKWYPVEHYCRMWLDSVFSAERFKARHPNDLQFIKLEDLVKQKTAVIKKVCAFAGIPFDASRLDAYKDVAQYHIQPNEYWKKDIRESEVSEKIANKASQNISKFEEKRIVNILADKMEQYGYKAEPVEGSAGEAFAGSLDVAEILKTLKYLARQEAPTANTAQGKKIVLRPVDHLKGVVEEFCKTSAFRHPRRKVRLGKRILKAYWDIKKVSDKHILIPGNDNGLIAFDNPFFYMV